MKAKREETKKLLKGLQEQYFSRTEKEILEDLSVSRGSVKELIRLTLRFAELFAEKKRRKNLLDYSDLEHFALNILLRKEGRTAGPHGGRKGTGRSVPGDHD